MNPIRIALAQFDFSAGAVAQNADRILELCIEARDTLDARLILFPELAISGYLAEDLFLRPSFIETCARELARVVEGIHGIDAIIGHPLLENGQLFNALSWVRDGRVLVRVSGTEPLVRVMLEGKDLEKITRLGNRIADVVRERLS